MVPLQAVIFDVDGTLADTERDGHRPAFNAAFAAHGLDIHWNPDKYGALLQITGGRRRIAHDLGARGYGAAAAQLAAEIHTTKTRLFRDSILDGAITARPGLLDFVSELRAADIRIAVATTGRRAWVEPLVTRLLGADMAEVLATGDDVQRLKPDAEVYHLALRQLGLSAGSAMAIEDSAVGLQAALGALLPTVIVTNEYTAAQDFSGAATVRAGFDQPTPLTAEGCRLLHRRWWAAAQTQ